MLFFSCLTILFWSVSSAIQLIAVHPAVSRINVPGNASLIGEGFDANTKLTVEFQSVTGINPNQAVIAKVKSSTELNIEIPDYSNAAFSIIRVKNESSMNWSPTPLLFQFYEPPTFSCCNPTQVSFTAEEIVTITGSNFFNASSITVKLSAPWIDRPRVVKVQFISESKLVFVAPITAAPASNVDSTVMVSLAMDSVNFEPQSGGTFGFIQRDLYKLAFLFTGPILDFGWTYSQNQGRKEIEMLYSGQVETEFREAVPDDEVEKLILEYCDKNFSLVFTGGFEYMEASLAAAKSDSCSNTHIVSATGYKKSKGMSNMFAKVYQAKYLAGMTAGYTMAREVTPRKSKCVGYLGGENIPEVYRGFNAFALGCQKAYPDCIVKVVFLNEWENPPLEKLAAEFIWYEEGCDIIAQETDSIDPSQVFMDLGGYSIGYNSDARAVVGGSVLTSPYVVWREVYKYFIDAMLKDGSMNMREVDYWPGMDAQAVNLWPFSNDVDLSTRNKVIVVWDSLKEKDTIFCGPLEVSKYSVVLGNVVNEYVGNGSYEDSSNENCLTEFKLLTWFTRVKGVEFAKARVTNNGAISYMDAKLTPLFYEAEVDWERPQAMGIIFILIGCIGISTVLFTFVFMNKHQKSPWFKAHSVKLMYFILMSCLLLFLLPILLFLKPDLHNCIVTRFVSHLAFIICAPPICLKTYRLHKFFAAARHLQTARCTDKQLISLVLAALLLFTIYSIVWFSLDPPVATRKYVEKIGMYHTSCSSPNNWDLFLIIPEVVVLIMAIQLVTLIRGIPKQFNESKYIAFTLYTVLVMGIVLVPLSLQLKDNEPYLTYFLDNFGAVIIGMVTFLCLFGVKIKKIMKKEQYASRLKPNFSKSGHSERSIGSQVGSGVGSSASLALKSPSPKSPKYANT